MNIRKLDSGYGLNWSGCGRGQLAGCCECGNETSGSIKCWVFLDWLSFSERTLLLIVGELYAVQYMVGSSKIGFNILHF
jgi:hypothetical protein